ncbi:cytochrome p450 domain-containing protein [Phthorimaea operculella]|nr:cytochrome p450 domain-containing protein [Phthorimaea operculella]
MIVTLLLLAIVFSYFLSTWLWRKLKKKGPREPPMYPGHLPIIGHAHLFIGDTVYVWSQIVKLANTSLENGGVVTVKLGTWTIYILTDPEDCYLVGNSCLDKDVVYDVAKPWLGDGLVTSSVHTWKRHRKLVNPAFSQHVLDGYLTVFNSQSRKLADILAKQVGKGFFNHEEYLKRTALEIICLTAMGVDDDEFLMNDRFMDAVDAMFHVLVERVVRTWMHNDFLYQFTWLRKKQDGLLRILHDMSNKIIQKRKAKILKPDIIEKGLDNIPKRFKSFLDLLLESSVDGSLSDAEIREEVDTMVSAGYDTSATLLTFAFVLIGSYPQVQDKVYEELQEVFQGSDRDVEKHDLPKLVYLEAVIKEVLRLYPVVPLIARQLNRDVELKNYTLTAGNSCFFLINGIHRHPVWGADRIRFKPERWLDPGELPDLPNVFAGFGVGRRSCIGPKFGIMSAKTTLSHVLRRYKIHADHTKMVLKMDIMLKPDSGHHINIEPR